MVILRRLDCGREMVCVFSSFREEISPSALGRNEDSNFIFSWNVTSLADGTEILGRESPLSNAAADDFQTLVHHSENNKATSRDETGEGLVIVLLAMPSGGTIVCFFE